MENERKTRLENTLATIEEKGESIKNFFILNELLENEYRLEGGDNAEFDQYSYNNHLRLTKQKATVYISMITENRRKGLATQFEIFVKSFKTDVETELRKFES